MSWWEQYDKHAPHNRDDSEIISPKDCSCCECEFDEDVLKTMDCGDSICPHCESNALKVSECCYKPFVDGTNICVDCESLAGHTFKEKQT